MPAWITWAFGSTAQEFRPLGEVLCLAGSRMMPLPILDQRVEAEDGENDAGNQEDEEPVGIRVEPTRSRCIVRRGFWVQDVPGLPDQQSIEHEGQERTFGNTQLEPHAQPDNQPVERQQRKEQRVKEREAKAIELPGGAANLRNSDRAQDGGAEEGADAQRHQREHEHQAEAGWCLAGTTFRPGNQSEGCRQKSKHTPAAPHNGGAR